MDGSSHGAEEMGPYRDSSEESETPAPPFLPRPGSVDNSPNPLERMNSSSTASTPLDAKLKRVRDEEIDAYPAVPPNKRMESTPCPTPVQSPARPTSRMQSTPIAMQIGTPLAGERPAAAAELRLRWAFSQRQGPRPLQEDRVACRLDDGKLMHAYFGVFDGHGGDEASEFCADSLHKNVLASPHFPELVNALQDGFLRTDADFLAKSALVQRKKESNAGTAAAVMMVTALELVLAHAGDCRAILVKRAGASPPFIELTSDHTAEEQLRPDELRRVEEAGGKCEAGYVYVADHNLPMTRAFGDMRLKVAQGRCWQDTPAREQVVTAMPEVRVFPRSADDLCVVIASDGLFGSVMTSEDVANYALGDFARHAETGHAEEFAARNLSQLAISHFQGADNVSVVVVGLDPPSTSPPCARKPAAPSAEELMAGMGASSNSENESVCTEGTYVSPQSPCGCRGASLSTKLRLPLRQAYPPRAEGCLNPPPLRQRNSNIEFTYSFEQCTLP